MTAPTYFLQGGRTGISVGPLGVTLTLFSPAATLSLSNFNGVRL